MLMPTTGADPWAPVRRPGSVRRTTSMHMRWPGEPGSSLLGLGAGRDLLTAADGGCHEVAGAELRVTLDPRSREIRAIGTVPHKPALRGLVGARAGLRAMLAQTVPEELEAGTVLYLL